MVLAAELAIGTIVVVVLLSSISQQRSNSAVAAFTGAAYALGTLFLLDLWRPLLGRGAVVKSGPYAIVLEAEPPPLPFLDEDAVERFLDERSKAVARLVGAGGGGAWGKGVPEQLQRNSVRRMSGLDAVAEFLAGSRLEGLDALETPETAVFWNL